MYLSDPWGPERDNMHVAMLLSQTANLHRKKGTMPINPKKFMLTRTKDEIEVERISALHAFIHQGHK